MTSYVALLLKIEAFCDAHLQIQRYLGEFREQMPNLSTESEKYPIVFVAPNLAGNYENTNQFTLNIYCVDIIQKDRSNINTIVSDTHLILTDLYQYFAFGDDLEVDIIGNPTMSPLNNTDLDYVAGWVSTITFEVNGYTPCFIPMEPITPGGDCEDATYLVEYENGTDIESGTIPSGGSKTITVPNPVVCVDGTVNVQKSDATLIASVTVASGATENYPVADSVVSNSDDSYTANVKATETLEIPDEDITLNGGAFLTKPSKKDQDIILQDQDSVAIVPMSVVGNTITVSTASGCDQRPTKTGQAGSTGRLADFLTLDEDNPYGNATRFLDEFGTAVFANNIIIDWATKDTVNELVLGYAKGAFGTFTRDTARTNAAGQTIGGFSTWRLPTHNEVALIMNWSTGAQLLQYAPINLTSISTWLDNEVTVVNGLVFSSASTSIFSAFAITNTRSCVLYSRYFTFSELGL